VKKIIIPFLGFRKDFLEEVTAELKEHLHNFIQWKFSYTQNIATNNNYLLIFAIRPSKLPMPVNSIG
jgi:hypothetical protein